MHSKEKGNIGEAIVLAEFTKRGVQVSIPFGDNARYDLVIDIKGNLYKVQVKYTSSLTRYNSVNCRCVSAKNHTTNKRLDSYIGDVDFLCYYIADWGEVVLVPIELLQGKASINFRRDTPKNNQAKNVYYIKDYTLDNYFGTVT